MEEIIAKMIRHTANEIESLTIRTIEADAEFSLSKYR